MDALARRYGMSPGQVVDQGVFDMGLMLAAAQAGTEEERKAVEKAKRGDSRR